MAPGRRVGNGLSALDASCYLAAVRNRAAHDARRVRSFAAPAAAAAVLVVAAPARADVSSWLFVGGGPSWHRQHGSALVLAPSLRLDTGFGTTPAAPLVLGWIADAQTHFGYGTDLGLSARLATRSFVTGSWGAALDAGGYARFWGTDSFGGQAALVLGAPWGITLSLNGARGSNDALSFSAVLGVDLLRLTVYRTAGQDWFPNPMPPAQPAR